MDRKAWIVVSICAILLAVNYYYLEGNAKILREAKLAEQAEKEAQDAKKNPAEKIPSVTVKPRPIPEDIGTEESHEIATPFSVFTLSNLEGGIVQNKFLEEKAFSGDGLITMNDLGLNRIGAITKISGESLEKGYYDPDESRKSETSITYKGPLSNNLIAQKTWTVVEEESAGSPYRLQFKLVLENTTNGEISLKDVAIFNGSAAPTYEDERPNYLNFFWNENGNYDSETTGYFSYILSEQTPPSFAQASSKACSSPGWKTNSLRPSSPRKNPTPRPSVPSR